VRYIQQLLGHGSLDTTKIYLRLVPGRLKEDYDRAIPEIAVGGLGPYAQAPPHV
jgi:site-specific recombinase XerD